MKSKFLSSFVLLFCLSLISSISIATASDQLDQEYKSMEDMVGAIRLEKKQVESMLDKMIVSGRISADEGSKAKREIASMKDDDLDNLKKRAIAEVKSKRLLDH